MGREIRRVPAASGNTQPHYDTDYASAVAEWKDEPRYQFWRPIQPVEGQPIPDGAEANVYGMVWAKSTLIRPGLKEFIPDDLKYPWRVPVEVVPIDLAVNLLICESWNGKYHVKCGGQMLEANTPEELREMAVAKLRELSQER